MKEDNQMTNYENTTETEDLFNSSRCVDQDQYTTNISELISEPETEGITMMTAQYIFSSLYQLSSYLFFKKMGVPNQGQSNSQNTLGSDSSFHSYLESMSEELGRFDKTRNSKQSKIMTEAVSVQAELIRCYQQVQQIYFQQKFFLNYSYFELFYSELRSSNIVERKKVNNQLDDLVDSLDLVEVNLFSQIHCKFHDYFAAAANFEYLHQSISLQLKKLKESRARAQKVKQVCVDKSVKLRRLIIQRQNIEKVMKVIKTVKSLKKLPQVMESILASSLPYECLQLLQQTKSTIDSVKSLHCLTNTADSVRQMQILAQNDLSKRYASELYLYLEECHNKEFINLEQEWKKIEMKSCLDKDSSLVIDELNSSTNSALSERSHIQDDLEYISELNEQANEQIHSQTLLPRHQGREYQIAMILLQSYQYVNFSPQVTKIKVCNALRMFSKRFQKQLILYLNEVTKNEIKNSRKSQQVQDQQQTSKEEDKQVSHQNYQDVNSEEIVEKVSVDFYVKHVAVFNHIFKETVSRFLGYLETLVTEYDEELTNEYEMHKEIDQVKVNERHSRFKLIFAEECSLLPSIFKIIEEKLKYLLTLKNISSITSLQFYHWISTLKYWQRYFEYLIESHPLLTRKSQLNSAAKVKVQELSKIVLQNVRKALKMLGLRTLLYDLTVGYINAYHKNTITNEIITTLQEDTWQSTEIPLQFSDILTSIVNPDGQILNSVTILDSCSTSRGSISRDLSKNDVSRQEGGKSKSKFKILKNNILVGGLRYKVNLSFLVLCEVLEQYLKMSRILSNVLPQQEIKETGYNRIVGFVFQKIVDLIEQYCVNCKELILETKALKFERIKGKNINAKHICLLCNCLSVVLKISEDLIDKSRVDLYGLSSAKSNLLAILQTVLDQLISKLALILNCKIEKDINDFFILEKQNPNINAIVTKTNNSIITSFLQMVEIADEYLDIESIKKVLKQAFQTLSQRYFIHLLLKGPKCKIQIQTLTDKIKFIRKYFVSEYDALLKEIQG